MKDYLINKKEIKLLEIINSYEELSAKEIAKRLKVTDRTVLNYIKNINSSLGEKIVEIKRSNNRDYYLEKKNIKEFELIIESEKPIDISLPEDRVKQIIRILTKNKKAIKIDDLADELFISRTTLVKDLKRVSLILQNYNIKLLGKQNEGIFISGNEMNIRFCLSHVLNNNHIRQNLYQMNKVLSDYEELSREFWIDTLEEEKFKVSNEDFKNLIFHTAIALERFKDDCCIDKLPINDEELVQSREFEICERVAKKIETKLKLKLPDLEIKYLSLHLIGRKPTNQLVTPQGNIPIKPQVKKLVGDMLEEIKKATGFDMKEDSELIWGLEIHLNFAINRIMFGMNIRNPLFEEIKRKYPLAYELAMISAKVIQRKFKVRVNDQEISYIALHIGSYIERNNLNKDIQKVAFVCGTGLGTAQMMLIKIKKVLSDLHQIKTFSCFDLKESQLEEFDIVFTTVDLDLKTQVPIIKVDVLFDEKDIKNQILIKTNERKKQKGYLFKQMIQKENFFILEKISVDEVIRTMASKFIDQELADDKLIERLLEREELSATSFGNFIALPHTVNHKGDSLELSVAVLKEDVVWGSLPVRLVFMMLIPENIADQAGIFIRVYEDILKFGQNKEIVQKLIESKDFESFVSKI